jgi:hypothetical protein
MQKLAGLPRGLTRILATALATAVLAGCGGETGGSTSLTKKEFLKQGNALCDRVLAERDTLAMKAYRKFSAEGGSKQISKADREKLAGKVVDETVQLYKKLVRELGELTPPSKEAVAVEKILSRYEAVLGQGGGGARKLREGRPLPPDAEAASYGLVTCGL